MPAAKARMEVIVADITTLDVDAIVNAANQSLAGGGGVDGAIHRAAGAKDLRAACEKLGGCPTGEAKITPGFKLKARHIIHAVGPRWRDGEHGEPDKLASAYRRSLEVAAENGVKSIAFPAISTGIYGFPADRAAKIAVSTTADFLSGHEAPQQVTFCCFSEPSADLHRSALQEIAA